ncbi:M20/M25/M40 family metallo-hydrolase [Dongshaea marina]|uniref:M20/M25/M40 family metallo-hydrolase n=1 Tax=Dongshaea marina TaxID=2047966 RepID=UPI001901BFB4|nr:M20/M25/M40 family metallo-hydrolase [Dongshaea marina]
MNSYRDYGITHRRYLHQHPELGREEHHTSSYCQQVLRELGYSITPCFHTGFYADLAVDPDYPLTAFRADMDALPAQECSEESFCSVNQGVAHLCGHDLHMAVALTAARMMVDHRHQLTSNIRLLFQPSEEMFVGGAQGMIAEGALKGLMQSTACIMIRR